MIYKSYKIYYANIILIPLVFLALYSFIFPRDSFIPYSILILEFSVFVYCSIFFIKYILGKKNYIINERLGIFYCFFLYLFTSLIYVVLFKNISIYDFLLSYKAFIYIAVLTFVTNNKIFNKNVLLNFINIIFLLFLIKYSISHIMSFRIRPMIYVENNFEVILLFTLYIVRIQLTKKYLLFYLFLLGIIILLSFSRSAIVTYAILFLIIVNRYQTKNKILKVSLSFILVGIMILFIFKSRAAGFDINSFDRFKFFKLFLHETKNWSFIQYLIGAPRITELSHYACYEVNNKNLFSYSGKDTCYSVIFHSYLLRVIFDHGILGFLSIIYSSYVMLKISNVKLIYIICFFVVMLINGLSVSSFNCVFFPISMIFMMGIKSDNIIFKF